MKNTMKTFDFSNTDEWVFIAGVFLDKSESEESQELKDAIFENMLESNNSDGHKIEIWGHAEARENCHRESRYSVKGTCDHCGAHFKYGAAFKNGAGEIAIVGNICASDNLSLTAHQYADQKLRTLAKAARTRAENEVKREKNRKILEGMKGELRDALELDNHIARNLKDAFIKWGQLTPRQEELALKIYRQEGKYADERSKLQPVVTGKGVTITGKVLSTKWIQSRFSQYAPDTEKMLVLDNRGFKVWGSVPGSLGNVQINDSVKFIANISASENDQTFGFFKRPRKAELLS